MSRTYLSIIALLIACPPSIRSAVAQTGPDLVSSDLWGSSNYYGKNMAGDISGYSIGSEACNIGDAEVSWYATTDQHPVLAMHLYRLKNGRMEQIGMSWARHGFFALAYECCPTQCVTPQEYGEKLGLCCANPSNANINGLQTRFGPRGHVNAFTGSFPFHYSVVPFPPPYPEPNVGRRLQVYDDDLDPALNEGALYYAEIQYLSEDDALAGNGENNASYHPVTVSNPQPGVYKLALTGSVVEQSSAIRAWKVRDYSVQETEVRVPDEGLFILAAKVRPLGSGMWRYEYALYNMNSDRSAQAFSVPIPPAGVSPVFPGFHDVDHHSGDGDAYIEGPFSTADWSTTIVPADSVTWATVDYDTDPRANALRWGTTYNFFFDANAEPASGNVTIDLFKPGTPSTVTATTLVPSIPTAGQVPAVSDWGQAAMILLFLTAGMIVFRRGGRRGGEAPPTPSVA